MTGNSWLRGGGARAAGDGSRAVAVSVLGRQSLGAPGWFWSGGAQAENFFFTGGPALPRRLRDYAARLSLEYFEGDENVGALTLRPGWYFENHPTMAAWDVPVDLTAGFPLTSALSGVVGFTNSRFFHHALPIAGLVWIVGPHVRLEMIFPEPAVVVTLGEKTTLRIGGELIGAGFLADARPGRTVVEYESYRVGVELSRKRPGGVRLGIGAGIEAERSFDFFRQQRRLHGSGAGYVKITAAFLR